MAKCEHEYIEDIYEKEDWKYPERSKEPELLDGRVAYRAVLQRMNTANPEDPAESLLPVDVLMAALPVAQEKGHKEAVKAIQKDFDTHIRIKS